MIIRFDIAPYRKLVAALVGAAAQAAALGWLDSGALAVAVAFLTALGVYAAPNEPDGDGERGAGEAVGIAVVVIAVVIVLWAFGEVPR